MDLGAGWTALCPDRTSVRFTRQARLAALLFATLACSDDGVAALPPGEVASVVVTPAILALLTGETGVLEVAGYDTNGRQVAIDGVRWETESASTVTVSEDGGVTGVAPGTTTINAFVGEKKGKATVTVTPPTAGGLVIDVQPNITHQTMTGWEGVTQIGEFECDRTAYPLYKNQLLDLAVNDLGLNRVRLQVRSGQEHPMDWHRAYTTGQLSLQAHRVYWFAPINDNADPQVMNPAGIHWSFIDDKIDHIVTPMRQRLAARGEQLYVNLNYVDFGNSTFEHSSNPQEYAELIVEAFRHIQQKYGWVPNSVEMILEPDNTPNWRGSTIGQALVATGDRLAAAGFHPAFIAPSTTNMQTAIGYFDDLIKVPRVLTYLTDISYHRYSGVSVANLQAIASRAMQHGLRTGMLEHIGSDYRDLHEDILTGRGSSWEQFAIGYCGTGDNGGAYYGVDQSNPTAPVIIEGSRTRVLKQYFRHIRLGAVRIGASSGDARFSPLAFRNTNGKFVVVIKGDNAGGALQIRGLPAGRYGIFFTDGTSTGTSPDVTIASQQALTAIAPAGGGVITVFQR